MNYAAHVDAMVKHSLFSQGEEERDRVIVDGFVQTFAFHRDRLEANRSAIKILIRDVVDDTFLLGGGGGNTAIYLTVDRTGQNWADQATAEAFFCLAAGLGLATYSVPRELWVAMPGGMPYIHFFNVEQGEQR